MSDIGPLFPNQPCHWANIPRNLHPKCSTEESKCERTNCCPTEWQQRRFIPRIKVIITPTASSKNQMLLRYDHKMYYCPISDYTQERLESILEESSSKTSNYNCSYEAK